MKKFSFVVLAVLALGFVSCSSDKKCETCSTDSTSVVTDSSMVDSTVVVSDSVSVDTVSK